jgi:hypothetical protein
MAKKKTRRRIVARHNIRRPVDTRETLKDLEARVRKEPQAEKVSHGKAIVHIKRSSIRVAEQAFQWRRFGNNWIRSDDHILEMARSVHEGGTPLTPILVLPVGPWFYVIDGHHRLAAYYTAGWKDAIPARVFEGSVQDAYREALLRNSQTHLPMTKSDKLSAAWTLVQKDDKRDSIAIIQRLTGVAKGTVNNMRSVWSTLTDGKHGKREDLMTLSWDKARMKAQGREEYKELEDWREAEAQKIIDKLRNAKLIGALTKNVDITALVLAMLDDSLPAMLTAEWSVTQERPFDPHEGVGEDMDF